MHSQAQNQLVFCLNGKPIRINNPDPHLLLIDFVRSKEIALTGTKLSCGEGGCGSCTVLLSRLNRESLKISHVAVNACLRPICSLDGAYVTTIEGLGNTRNGLHPIQARIAEMNGSQCGFCTPGMVMNAFSLLQSVSTPTQQSIEDHLDGHICRCTGYRPILQALRSFAIDYHEADSADSASLTKVTDTVASADAHPQHQHNLYARGTSNSQKEPFSVRGQFNPPIEILDQSVIQFPAWLSKRNLDSPRLEFARKHSRWIRPKTLDEVLEIKNTYSSKRLKLVVGNTSIGIYKKETPQVLVDISDIPDLAGLEANQDGIQIGASVALEQIIAFGARVSALLIDPISSSGLGALCAHLKGVANLEVRSVASIGGNIAMTRAAEDTDDPFPSDVDTVLTTLGAEVRVASRRFPNNFQTFKVDELPMPHALPPDAVIVDFKIPLTRAGEHVRTYKVAMRPQNAHAIVNAGFRARIDAGRVTEAVFAFGGIGRRTIRAEETETLLLGKSWSDETLRRAVHVLSSELKGRVFPYADLSQFPAEYRISLAASLFYKFFVSVADSIAPSSVADAIRSAGMSHARPLSHGTQEVRVDTQQSPVGDPLVNRNAYLQASGEAMYTQDLPLPNHGFHGAVVLSRKAKAKFSYPEGLVAFVAELRREFPLVKAFITAADVPGQNLQGLGGDEFIFADKEVLYHGQLIGIVISRRSQDAALAAGWVEENIIYLESPSEPAILDVDEALHQPGGKGKFQNNNKFVTVIPELVRAGSDDKWLANPTKPIGKGRVIEGTQMCAGQAHFYMETQTCLAIPDERRTIQLYSSTQSPATDQSMTAIALGIPVAQVQLEVRRVGGGFGGKQFRAAFTSAATAVAAWSVNRPVRVSLRRNDDMALVGKRHPFRGHYSVSVNDDGKIDGMRVDLVSNGGCTLDCSFPVMNLAQQHADCCYFVPTFKTTGTVVRTNHASNTAMRTFGVVQTTLIVEEAMERTAHELGIPPEDLRRNNFYETATKNHFQRTHYGQALKYCNLFEVWNALMEKAEFEKRKEAVVKFNREHRWRKRGISVVPLKFGMGFQPRMMDQATALVNVYATDGSVYLQHGGVEMGQGLNTKMQQIAAESLGIPMDWIVMGDTWTGSIPNAIATAASTASDLNGGAIRNACTEVRKRLEQFCIEKDIEDWQEHWQRLWPTIVAKAYEERLNLNSQAHFKVPFIGDIEFPHQYGRAFHYFTYSASCSEVEIDVLTGETSIVRADLLYDAGRSLNPCIDIGQLEGGFVQGCGMMLSEDLIYRSDGSLLSNGTWDYKPPCSKSIPIDFRIGLHYGLRQDPVTGEALDYAAVLGSKGIGEPGLVLSTSVFFAVKHAIHAARVAAGSNDWFEMPAPATVARVQLYCSTPHSSLRLKTVR